MKRKISRILKKFIAASLVIALVGGISMIGSVPQIAAPSIVVNAVDMNAIPYTLENGVLTIQPGTYTNPKLDTSLETSEITKIVARDLKLIGTCEGLFKDYDNAEEIDLTGTDTSEATSLASFFANCSSLKKVDVSGLDTSNVENLYGMFQGCSSLKKIDLSTFKCKDNTSLHYLLYKCSMLEEADLSGVTVLSDYYNIFSGCNNITRIKLKGGSSVSTQASLNNMDTSIFSYAGWYREDDPNQEIISGDHFCAVLNAETTGTYIRKRIDNGINISFEDGVLTLISGTFTDSDLQTIKSRVSNGSNPIKKIVAGEGVAFTGNCKELMAYFYDVTEIDISKADTSAVTNMNRMFEYCGKLEKVSLGDFDTANVTDMSRMFEGCSSIKEVVFGSKTDTTKVSNMENMFSNCLALTKVDFKNNWNTENVTKTGAMFNNCKVLTNISSLNFKTDKVTDFSQMFQGCSSIETFDLSSFSAAAATNVSYMFADCYNLKSVDLSHFNVGNSSTSVYLNYMFRDCYSLNELDISAFGNIANNYQTNMFSNCEVSKITKGRDFTITANASLTNKKTSANYKQQFTGWIKEGDPTIVSGDGSYAVLNGQGTFVLQSEAGDIDYTIEGSKITFTKGTFKRGIVSNIINYENKFGTITELYMTSSVKFEDDAESIFSSCAVEKIDISDVDISNVTDMSYMFSYCTALKEVKMDASKCGNVYTMGCLFSGCYSLETVDFMGNINASKLTSVNLMFSDCYALKKFDTKFENATDLINMSSMFGGCDSLESVVIDAKGSMISDFSYMFSSCQKLTDVTFADISYFVGTTNFSGMFNSCVSLKTLDLSSIPFDTDEENSNFKNMFENCNVEKLTLHSFSKITEDMRLRNVTYDKSSNEQTLGWAIQGTDTVISGYNDYALIPANYDAQDTPTTYVVQKGTLSWDYENDEYRTVTLKSGVYNSSIMYQIKDACMEICGEYGGEPYGHSAIGNIVVEDGVQFSGDCSNIFDIAYYGNYAGGNVTFEGSFDTSKITNMSYMFGGGGQLPNIHNVDFSTFDTSSATDMSGLFAGSPLEVIDLSNFDTSKVTRMAAMFKDAKAKGIIFGDKFVTDNVTDMTQMFADCADLTDIDLSGFNTSKVGTTTESGYYGDEVGMYRMFGGCSSIKKIDCSSFDTTQVTSMKNMFEGCSSVKEIILGEKFHILNISYSGLDHMFAGCTSLETLDLSSFGDNDPENSESGSIENIYSMFKDCSSLKSIDLSGININYLYNIRNLFENCSSLENVVLSPCMKSTDSWFYNETFKNCPRLTKISIPSGSQITTSAYIDNANSIYTGWHKTDETEIVSGENEYAEFNVPEEETVKLVTYVRDYIKHPNNTINGASLTLDGQIGVNFYAVFTDDILSDKDAYVLISGPKGEQKLLISSADIDYSNGLKFTYKISAKQIHDDISFTVYHGDGTAAELYKSSSDEDVKVENGTYNYSAASYIDSVKANSDNYSEKLVSLVNALEAYGSYAQLYFHYNTKTVDTSKLISVESVTADSINGYKASSWGDLPDGVEYMGHSLILDSETTLKVFFKADSESLMDFYDNYGNAMDYGKTADGLYYVEFKNIPANDLDEWIYFNYGSNSDAGFNCNPLSYAYTALNKFENNAEKQNLCNTMRAMKLYSDAANDYFSY